jgi:23S rRNA (adenine2503-C2)-methyltransferase
MKWIHHRYVTDFGEMTDLGKVLRAKLEARAVVHAPQVVLDKASEDGTHKWLLGMDAKNAIETVYIPDKGRGTLCVSVAGGLRAELPVLLDRHPGLQPQSFHGRDHRPGLGGRAPPGQRAAPAAQAHQRGDDGHGRAPANFENVVRAMSIMRDDLGYGLANKRVTLSTAGMVPMIDKLGEERRVAGGVAACAVR